VAWKRKLNGSILGFVGFMLSPLSWWNDAFINLPLAVAFGWLIALAYRPAFDGAVVVGYWLTNVLGFVLMHRGIGKLTTAGEPKPYTWHSLVRDMAISLLYTGLLVLLLKLKFLKPFTDYIHKD
jgi:hypothetical protein